MNRGPYQSYSRDFKVAILSKGGTRSDIRVPRSTKHYWKHKGVGRLPLFGQGLSSTDTEHAIQALDIQRRLVRLLAATVTNLAREGRFNAAIILTVWTDLKRRLDEDTLRELKEFLPRDVLTKITAPICEKSGDGKCLKRYPHQIALSELKEMKRLVTSKHYAHFSTSSLCLYAKRKELVSCNRDTWYRYINRYGWERPLRNRKFKLVHSGLRATRPDEVWHVDATHIKLSDGTGIFFRF